MFSARADGDGIEKCGGDLRRRQTVRRRAVAELPERVRAPTRDLTACVDGAGERPPCAHLLGLGHARHVRRPRAPDGVAQAKLSRPVGAPARHRAARTQRAGVVGAGAHGTCVEQANGVDRSPTIHARVVPELTLIVKSPAPDAAGGGAHARVSGPDTQRHGIDEIADLHGNGTRRDRAVTKLPDGVGAPADHAAGDEQRAGMIAAGGDGDRRCDAGHGDRQRRRGDGDHAVPELAGVVSAPALDRAIAQHDAGMVALDRHGDSVTRQFHAHFAQGPPVAPEYRRTEHDNERDGDGD